MPQLRDNLWQLFLPTTKMTTEATEVPPSPAPALFELDLGANGGVLSPTNARELHEWVQTEQRFWSWVTSVTGGNHRNAIDQSSVPLHHAMAHVQDALQYEISNPSAFQERITQVQSLLQDAYTNKGLPHSSTPLAKRIEQIRQRDPLEAQAYLFTFLPSQGYHFDGRDLSSWRGFLEGISERFGLSTLPVKESYEAAFASVDDLRTKTERMLSEKSGAFAELHRHYSKLAAEISETEKSQKSDFARFIEDNQKTHDDALAEHKKAMSNLEQVFREKMTLRAPVEYWEGRQQHHDRSATITGCFAFGAMTVLACAIGAIAYWVLNDLTDAGRPEAWRVAVMVLVGVLGIWAVRLIVRMFLSHVHLATDAAERVTMVKTYLSLLEGDKLPSDDDRKLILQALFRPASDGIVKDEGLPHPALEALTRFGGR